MLARQVRTADRNTKAMATTLEKNFKMSTEQATRAVKKHQSSLTKQAKATDALKTKVEILKAKLQDHGVVVGQVTNWDKLRTKALKGNKVAISQLNRAVNTAIATERKRKKTVEDTHVAITIATHGWKKYLIAMRGGKVGSDPGGPLGVRNLRNATKMGSAFSVLRSKLLLASFAFGLVNRGIVKFVELAGKQEAAEKKVSQAIVSTGAAAGLGTTELVEYAKSLQSITTFGDEAILSSSALLLTFKEIKGGTFKEAQKMILDVSSAMGQDLKTSTIQLGKALNDPIIGIGALNRVGIQFTKAQKLMIRNFQEGNEVAKAQAIILGELESQFGGMAIAVALTAEGSLKQLGNAFGDMGEEIGENLAPLVLLFSENLKEMAESGKILWMELEFLIEQIVALSIGFVAAKISIKVFDITMKRLVMTTVEATAANHAFRLSLARTGIGIAAIAFGELIVYMTRLNDLIGEKKGLAFNMGDFAAKFGKMNEQTRIFMENQLREELFELQDTMATLTDNTQLTYNVFLATFKEMKQGHMDSIVLSDSLAELAGKTTMTQEEFNKFFETLKGNESLMMNQLNAMVNINKEQDAGLESIALAEDAYRNSAMAQAILLDVHIQRLRAMQREGELMPDQLEGLGLLEDKLGALYEKMGLIGGTTIDAKKFLGMTEEEWTTGAQMVISSYGAMTSAMSENTNAREKMALDELKKTTRYARASADKKKDLEKEVTDNFKIEKEKAWKAQRNMNIASATMSAYEAVTGALGAKPWGLWNIGIAAMIAGMAFKQVTAIATMPMPAFAKGGDFVTSGPQAIMVGDNPGGRERVQVTPLSSDNIDGPQGSGVVNITFEGNVMSQDFIEDEAIPMIKEAIRRGADIGVA